MILWLNEKLNGDDEGFTLIELMVVVLIIAILIAIAIPTFLGARRRAQDRQAQSNLRNALTAEKTYYADAQNYTTDESSGGDLQDIESNLAWGTVQADQRGVDIVNTYDAGQTVVIRSLSKSGVLFCIADMAQNVAAGSAGVGETNAGTYYQKVDPATSATNCTTAAADWGPTTASW
jgi:type IV pilus assembly protein PilA